jgi:hypothetical protein
LTTDVFLKAFYCDDFYCKNIEKWKHIFNSNKYKIKIVCPKSQASCFAFKFDNEIIVDGNGVDFQKHKTLLSKMGERWMGPAVSNLTCAANSKSAYFWNIDADSWVSHPKKDVASLLEQIEKKCLTENLHIASLDYYRTTPLVDKPEWHDHWSFGVAFQKSNMSFLEDGIKTLEEKDFECEWKCNMDRVLDQIRKKSKGHKIITFAIVNLMLDHRGVLQSFGSECKLNNGQGGRVMPYPKADDYLVISKAQMKDTTLVIQGALKEETYKFYCSMYPDTPKVFSTWVNNSREKAWSIKQDLHGPNDLFLENKKPNDHGVQNINLQTVSTLSGLHAVSTKYAIKLRGDEWYSNLSLVEELVRDNDEKIHTSSAFFRKWDLCPMHPSDHLMASSTKNLTTMFSSCLISILKNDFYPNINQCVGVLHHNVPMTPECLLAKAYMDAKLKKKIYSKEEFKNFFDIVPMDQLRYYKITANGIGKTWYSNFNPHDDGSIGSINSIDEL